MTFAAKVYWICIIMAAMGIFILGDYEGATIWCVSALIWIYNDR